KDAHRRVAIPHYHHEGDEERDAQPQSHRAADSPPPVFLPKEVLHSRVRGVAGRRGGPYLEAWKPPGAEDLQQDTVEQDEQETGNERAQQIAQDQGPEGTRRLHPPLIEEPPDPGDERADEHQAAGENNEVPYQSG